MEKEALELYYKFYNILEHKLSEEYSPFEKEIIKECALIAIDEIIELLSKDINTLVNYWFKVKQEIEKL